MVLDTESDRPLKKSYKGVYPFRLCTTSFIHPAGYAQNVERIGAFVDEIELLFFETLSGDLNPLKEEVRQLGRLSQTLNVSYNVHLPTDVRPDHENRTERCKAVDALKRVIDMTATLSPSTWTLHLPVEGDTSDVESLKVWYDRTIESVGAVIDWGVPPQSISVETLDYPFSIAEPIIRELDLSVCMDIGHLIGHGFDYETLYKRLKKRITTLHLHGVAERKDHLSLDRLAPRHTTAILQILKKFKGVASVEVFSYDRLKPSLEFLEQLFYQQHDTLSNQP